MFMTFKNIIQVALWIRFKSQREQNFLECVVKSYSERIFSDFQLLMCNTLLIQTFRLRFFIRLVEKYENSLLFYDALYWRTEWTSHKNTGCP